LASKKTTTVGVIVPDVTNLFFASLARGIDDIATMYKYNIILANSDQNDQKEIQVLNTLLAKQVDGIIYMGNKITDELRAEFSRSKTPVVLAGTIDPEQQVGSVNIDYIGATEEVVANMIANGKKNIAFVSASLSNPINGQHRLKGYKNALVNANIAFDEALVFECEPTLQNGELLAEQLLEAGVDAAYVAGDELAIGLLNGIINADVSVPEEFEVTASNNSRITEMARPKLTSIMLPLYDIGAVAMRLLTKIMNKEEIDEKSIILPYKIVNRGTTLPKK
jgi:LacI family transcriptional regulator